MTPLNIYLGGEKGVISMYKWSRIKSMKAQGKSIRSIAKELRISRNTVRRYVRQEGPPRYERRVKRCKRATEGFEERVKELLKEKYIGTEIFECQWPFILTHFRPIKLTHLRLTDLHFCKIFSFATSFF